MQAGLASAGNNISDYNINGYAPVKFVRPDSSWSSGKGSVKGAFVTQPKPFAIIRYAEVLLEYIEALNRVAGTVTVTTPDVTGTDIEVTISRDIQEVARYFNMVRYRIGLPGPALGGFNEVERFKQIIRNGRQVELFNEGYRYFDTRRWGTYLTGDANASNQQGLDVQKDRTDVAGNPRFWNVVTTDRQNTRDRVTLPKMVFIPIGHSELLKVPSTNQSPGWDR